jgi:hypothetical protein
MEPMQTSAPLMELEPLPTERTGNDRIDIARGALVWTGRFRSDLWFYLRNNHALLSIFLAHPLHPYGPCARLTVFLSTICFAFSLALLQDVLSICAASSHLTLDRNYALFNLLPDSFRAALPSTLPCPIPDPSLTLPLAAWLVFPLLISLYALALHLSATCCCLYAALTSPRTRPRRGFCCAKSLGCCILLYALLLALAALTAAALLFAATDTPAPSLALATTLLILRSIFFPWPVIQVIRFSIRWHWRADELRERALCAKSF